MYWPSQSNAWNTQPLWSSVVARFDMEARSQRRCLYGIVDTCSAHLTDYTTFESYRNVFLPPKNDPRPLIH